MTEQDWLECADPGPMLEHIGINRTSRKHRLFDIACCRRVLHLLTEEGRNLVSVLERFMEGQASDEELDIAFNGQSDFSDPGDVSQYAAADLVSIVADNTNGLGADAFNDELAAQSKLVRDIFGNPFRPVSIGPSWLTPKVVALAQQVYDDRAFDRLPVFADALEVASCTNADILNHCRGPGPHVRGCWAVDLVMGKE